MRRILIATAGLLLAAACGSQQPGTGVASLRTAAAKPSAGASPTGTVDPAEQGRKFARCMREHGIDMSDPAPDSAGGFKELAGKGIDKEKVKKAADACRAVAPFKYRPELDPQRQEQLRAFAKCMREHGVDMPDPQADGRFAGGTARNLKLDDPAFRKTFETCRGGFPGRGGTK